ncbi:MAG: hypothetical protein E7580_04630 [Ruminococcaceae bacterium]|nr:hypothetical protein [Oscillospiraceae bacterium]
MSVLLKAGFAKRDITPAYSVPLGGYGSSDGRMSKENIDPLFVSCVAVSDGESTVLFYQVDVTDILNECIDACRKGIFETCGVPAENIFITATHTHSSPDENNPAESVKRFLSEMNEAIIATASEAIADLEEAQMYIGKGKTQGLNYVRRYILSDGSYGADNYGDFKRNEIIGHEDEPDEEMQVLRWKRVSKKDILMVNWQSHPHRTGGFRTPYLSSDLIHHFRVSVENANFHFAYFQGCAGNLNPFSRLRSEDMVQNPHYVDDAKRGHAHHGKKLAKTCFDILPSLRKVNSGKIRTLAVGLTQPINHEWDPKVPDAEKALALWDAGKSDEAKKLSLELGFNSIYHAMYVIRHSKLPETMTIPMGGVSMGDFAFVAAPNELYDTTGKYVKASSPFEMTFVCGYTNGSHYGAYLPTIKAFAHGGYGCDTCCFKAGIAEKVADTMIETLVKLYQGS